MSAGTETLMVLVCARPPCLHPMPTPVIGVTYLGVAGAGYRIGWCTEPSLVQVGGGACVQVCQDRSWPIAAGLGGAWIFPGLPLH